MFLRQNKRRKNSKVHRYFSVVENRRTGAGTTTQRQVPYLGEINDTQQEAWRRTLRVFDEDRGQYCELSLFPDDRPLPNEAVDAISVKLDPMELRRPRSFGDCWLGCWLWDKLQRSSFWNVQRAEARGDVPWAKGTGWGKPGTPWTGGNPDLPSTFRKVFRVADYMRYTGTDVYHRDWGWWDVALLERHRMDSRLLYSDSQTMLICFLPPSGET